MRMVRHWKMLLRKAVDAPTPEMFTSNPRNVHLQVGWGPEQSDLVGRVPAHGRSIQLNDP